MLRTASLTKEAPWKILPLLSLLLTLIYKETGHYKGGEVACPGHIGKEQLSDSRAVPLTSHRAVCRSQSVDGGQSRGAEELTQGEHENDKSRGRDPRPREHW